MRLRALWLKNIRSYRDKVVVFPEKGVTTIYGDVGSGKTTLFASLSFLLFGSTGASSRQDPAQRYAAPRAEDLLRRGETRGHIQAWIRLRDKELFACRRIELRGGVARDAGGMLIVIRRGGRVERRSLSAEELRARLLAELGLPEDRRRGLPIVFTSALYVPQFNIASTAYSDDKAEIINRSLNLHKYDVIRENLDALASHIRREKLRLLQVRIEDLEKQVKQLPELRAEEEAAGKRIGELEKEIGRWEEKLREAEEKAEGLRARLMEARAELEKYKTLREEMEKLRREAEEKEEKLRRLGERKSIEEEVRRAEEDIARLEEERARLEKSYKDKLSLESELEEKLAGLREEKEKLEKRLRKLADEKGRIIGRVRAEEKKLREAERLVEKGICPTCRQPVSRQHGSRLVEEIRGEIGRLKRLLEEKEEEVGKAKEKLRELREAERKIEAERRKASRELREISSTLSNIEGRLRSLEKRKAELEKRVKEHELLEQEVGKTRKKLEKLGEELEKLSAAAEKLREIEDNLRKAEEEVGKTRKKLDSWKQEKSILEGGLKELRRRIGELEKHAEELEKLRAEEKKLKRMLGFVKARGEAPLEKLVAEIESYVRRKAHQIFRYEFRRLIDSIMEDAQDYNADVDEDFTPIFMVRGDNGQWYTISMPSGGQVSSVALAYRLALNSVARAMIPQISGGLLILDEPTYGFSPERVERLREVLENLDASQILVVTHDRKLVMGGTYRIRLELEGTVTKVTYEDEDPEEEENRRMIEDAMRRLACSPNALAPTFPETPLRPFQPSVKPLKKAEHKERKPRSLLDYIK